MGRTKLQPDAPSTLASTPVPPAPEATPGSCKFRTPLSTVRHTKEATVEHMSPPSSADSSPLDDTSNHLSLAMPRVFQTPDALLRIARR